jgi:uncharacterized protein YcfL
MKKFKILVLLVAVLSIGIYSCSDENPVNEQAVVFKSISLRSALNQIKKDNNITGRTTLNEPICFAFVYPLTLSYNNGIQVVVASYEGLLDLLESENANLYLEGINFPFQVSQNGEVSTINNEDEFYELIDSCDFNNVGEDMYLFDCYDIVYPFSVILNNNQTVVINSQEELFNIVSSSTIYIFEFVYPISLTENGQVTEVTSDYELFTLLATCDIQGCICNFEHNPVCVYDSSGELITYGNPCFAECDGYTAADFIDCGIIISGDFGSQLGACFNINYPAQVEYQNTVVTVNNNGELLQYWFPNQSAIPAFVYPVTFTFINQNSTVAVNSQAELLQLISQNCN